MASIEFVDPTSGRPALPTMSCVLHRSSPVWRTASRRKTGSSIFVVHHGTGQSVIGGQVFRWSPGDMFVVPSWEALDHEADTTADIFEVSDEATVRALRLFRDETSSSTRRSPGSSSRGASSPGERRTRSRPSCGRTVRSEPLGQADLIWGHASMRDPEWSRRRG